jgi:hypothetical protein
VNFGDSAEVKKRLPANSRGVQVLSLWLEEGAPTAVFGQALEEIIKADGSADQLIAGLLNTSIVLLHSAASAVGASARGFLAGMLNVYPDFDDQQPVVDNGTPESGQTEDHQASP